MLEGLGNLGDFIGGIGVAVTLVYLALQIRHNTRGLDQNNELLRVSFENQFRQNLIDQRLAIASNAELADIWHRGLQDPECLEPAEAVRFEILITNIFAMLSAQFDAHARDIYPLTQAPWLRIVASSPGFRRAWTESLAAIEALGGDLSTDNREFWDYVESFQASNEH